MDSSDSHEHEIPKKHGVVLAMLRWGLAILLPFLFLFSFLFLVGFLLLFLADFSVTGAISLPSHCKIVSTGKELLEKGCKKLAQGLDKKKELVPMSQKNAMQS